MKNSDQDRPYSITRQPGFLSQPAHARLNGLAGMVSLGAGLNNFSDLRKQVMAPKPRSNTKAAP